MPKVIANLAEYSSTSGGRTHWIVRRPRLRLHCGIDDGPRGFDIVNPTADVGYQFLTYKCRDCGQSLKTFSVQIRYKDRGTGIVEVMKLGECLRSLPRAAKVGWGRWWGDVLGFFGDNK